MSVRIGQDVVAMHATRDGTDATGTPTATLYVNGAANGASASVFSIATGLYAVAVTLPATLAYKDTLAIVLTSTVTGVTAKSIVWQDVVDSRERSVAVTGVDGATATFSNSDGFFSNGGVVGWMALHEISRQTRFVTAVDTVSNPGDAIVTFDAAFTDSYPEAADRMTFTPNRSAESGESTSASDIAEALAGRGVPVLGIVRDRAIDVVRGDDYSTDPNARKWRFNKLAADEPWPDDLTDHAITLYAEKLVAAADGDDELTLTGSIVTATGDDQEVKFLPTSADTATIALGVGNKGYEFWVVASKDGNDKTLRHGYMTVRRGRPQ